MDPPIYEKLREQLDKFPTSYPKTEEGLEIQILKKLFSKEEAVVACLLPLHEKEAPIPAEKVSSSMDLDAEEVKPILAAMAKKGLVHVEGEQPSQRYALLPFLPGIYEFNFDRMDRELADLLQRYMSSYLYREAYKSKVPMGRLIPVGRSISSKTQVRPFEDMVQAIETSSSLTLTPCICKTKKKALDRGCDYPDNVCIYLNDFADYLNRIGKGRRVTKEEAIDILQQTEEAGLVHMTANTQMTTVICSCCPCCCDGLRGLIRLAKMEKLDAGPVLNFRAAIDQEDCILCDTCIERCHTNALALVGESVQLNPARCIGCGLCVYTCPTDSLSLVRKPEAKTKESPKDVSDLFSQMGWRD
jgi:electron transport complex protein RnfB